MPDLDGCEAAQPAAHLRPWMSQFRYDHPDPARNVFVMMRFQDTSCMRNIVDGIKDALNPRGYHVIRADDRDYSGELWTNVQLCMIGSKLGVAVFEDLDKREHDSNIGIELGYMLALNRRCLILKEQRLPSLPIVIGHRLYRVFDAFDATSTTRQAVTDWIVRDVEGRNSAR
jgi:hypothetical protein